MEASSAVHKCVQQTFIRSLRRGGFINSTNLPSKTQLLSTRIQPRYFSSAPRSRQNAPPQPQPVSQEKSAEDAVGTIPPRRPTRTQTESIPKPDPNKRIDLSTLPGIPSSYVPPGGRSQQRQQQQQQQQAGSASAKLDALFNLPRRTGENPYQKAIRQTDALDRRASPSSPPAFNPMEFLETLETKGSNSSGGGSNTSLEPEKIPLRLRPTLGRSQSLSDGRGIDLTRAFRMLEMKCTANGVRRDMVKQRFHVRRGQRRKLDRSLRWRVAFKAGFLEECARVRRMKNQGW